MAADRRIDVINGLRGVAILSVYMIHSIFGHLPDDHPITLVARTGWFGVELFFLLSGFVLFLPYTDGRRFSVNDFYIRRALRLLPLFWIAAIVTTFVSSSQTEPFWPAFLDAATFKFFFTAPGAAGMPSNPPTWSIAVEVYLSLLFPFLVMIARKIGTLRLALSCCFVTFIAKLGYSFLPTPYFQEVTASWRVLVVAQALSEFALGMAVAQWWTNGSTARLNANAAPMLIGCAIAIGGILYISVGNGNSLRPISFGWYLLFFPIADLLLALGTASALCLPPGLLRRALTLWPLQLLGAMCFSFYIWHRPLLNWLHPMVIKSAPEVLLGAAFALVVIAPIAFISYRLIEFPRFSWRKILLLPV